MRSTKHRKLVIVSNSYAARARLGVSRMTGCAIKACLAAAFVAPLAGCLTTDSGDKSVTLGAIKIVCLSRKDTQETKEQVSENNAALTALGAPKRDCKPAIGQKIGAQSPTS